MRHIHTSGDASALCQKGSTMRKTYYIGLQGLSSPEGTMSLEALSELAELISEISAKSLRLSVDGSSYLQSKPKWVKRATDFLITGIKKGSTIIEIAASPLGESAKEAIRQQNIWNSVPSGDETAMSVVLKSLKDIERENLDSPFIDRGVLDCVARFKEFCEKERATMFIAEKGKRKEKIVFNHQFFHKIEAVTAKTPAPRAVILSGVLEQIAYSKSRFQMECDDGSKAVGIFSKDHIDRETIRSLWGKRVTVKGIGSFRPSGKLATIEVDALKPFEAGEEIFARSQASVAERPDAKSLAANEALKTLWGKWPEEEPIETLLEALKS